MKSSFYKLAAGLLTFFGQPVIAETTQEAIRTFEQHTRSDWLQQIDRQAEAVTRNPRSIADQVPNLTMAYSPLVSNGQRLKTRF